MDDLAADAELAATLVTAAGRLAARMRSAGLATERKSSITDLVSAADRAAEALVAERLRAARPSDGLIGEEGTRIPSGPPGPSREEPGGGLDGRRTWVVDPVDGTYDFLAGLPMWCSALALAADPDVPLLGAVYQATTDELWVGGPDMPTTCNGAGVARLEPDRPLAEMALATYLHPPRLAEDATRAAWLRALGGAATVRALGSGSVELAAVAGGRLGAWLHLDSPAWDWLPGAALVRAAGGATEVVEAHGHRWHVAGSARAVAELAALIRG